MKAQVKSTKECVEVSPYYQYGRIVAYTSDNIIEGIDFGGKRAYLPNELDFDSFVTTGKSITFYVDRMPLYEGVEYSSFYTTHEDTLNAILQDQLDIHTTSLIDLWFVDLLNKGYKIYVVKNGVKLEFYPGMPNSGNKDIRPTHDIRRLIISGFFDEDFGIKK